MLNSNALAPLRKALFRGKATIFMLHRIAPLDSSKIAANENMKISPEFLEGFIKMLRDEGYSFLSLDSLASQLENNSLKEKSIIFSIDDGYKDNFTYAYPIFSKYEVPFCIYVCASYLEKSADMWWYGLEDFLLKQDSFTLLDKTYHLDTKEQRDRAFLEIRDVLIANLSDYTTSQKTLKSYGISYNPRDYDNLCLNSDEIKTMLGGGNLTLGHHTYSHPIFNNLSNTQITSDITKANEIFKSEFGFIPKHFAYPFGSRIEVSQNHFSLIKDLGFRTATTTRSGTIFNKHKEYLHALPRIFLNENFNIHTTYNFRKQRIITN